MKIFYIVKNIDKVPSCHYNILMLHHLGYTVIPVFGRSTETINQTLLTKGITPVIMNENDEGRLRMYYRFRQFVKKRLQGECGSDDVVFIGTADTAISVHGIFQKYRNVVCIKELYDDDTWYYQRLLAKICRSSDVVVACEKNRAHFMKIKWKLREVPLVVSNRPFYETLPQKSTGSVDFAANIIQKFDGYLPIVYQSFHLWYADQLVNLAKALRDINRNYLLVFMGIVDDQEDINRLKEIYPHVLCTGYVKSPLHMEITSNAHIGITVYQETSLNNLFCAPNKIYEYSCFGIPTLANDVPGLLETVAVSGSGVCVDWNNVDAIKEGILKMEADYDTFQKNSIAFYQKTDNLDVLRRAVEMAQNKRK